jgi:hypothetical protein
VRRRRIARAPARRGRSRRGRIKTPERLNHVANELHSHRFAIGRRKYVDDAAANRKGAVLIDWIFADEAAVHQQVGQALRLDLRADAQLNRGR